MGDKEPLLPQQNATNDGGKEPFLRPPRALRQRRRWLCFHYWAPANDSRPAWVRYGELVVAAIGTLAMAALLIYLVLIMVGLVYYSITDETTCAPISSTAGLSPGYQLKERSRWFTMPRTKLHVVDAPPAARFQAQYGFGWTATYVYIDEQDRIAAVMKRNSLSLIKAITKHGSTITVCDTNDVYSFDIHNATNYLSPFQDTVHNIHKNGRHIGETTTPSWFRNSIELRGVDNSQLASLSRTKASGGLDAWRVQTNRGDVLHSVVPGFIATVFTNIKREKQAKAAANAVNK